MECENVWDYPRPPVCKPHVGTIKIIVNKIVIAKTECAIKLMETSHPPSYYIPLRDVNIDFFRKNLHTSYCEWKGFANYLDLSKDGISIPNIAWYYKKPKKDFLIIKNLVSFYASKNYECFVNDELVTKQDGDFYGGWITKNLKGPFKGGPKTSGW